MKHILLLMAAVIGLSACEPKKGVGLTGIGPAPTQAQGAGYALDFVGLGPLEQTRASQSSAER